METVPRFTESPASPRCILDLAGELASISLLASRDGFRLTTVDQSPLLDDEPASITKTPWINWTEAWEALERYPWVCFCPMQVDPSIASDVQRRARLRLEAESDRVREHWDERWTELAAEK